MKNRICLLREHLLYYCFNRNLILAIFWAIYGGLGVIFLLPNHNDKICEHFIFTIVISFAIIIVCRNHGSILLGIHSPSQIFLTMRSIPPHKLDAHHSKELNHLFYNELHSFLENRKDTKNIIINTHILYAQGVINLLYEMYAPNEQRVSVEKATKNKKCICNSIEILVQNQGKHINHMASIKIPLTAEQDQIDAYFKKRYSYYRICIPKELFIKV